MKYLNTEIEFFTSNSVQKGFVIEENGSFVIVKITHGKNCGQTWDVPLSDIIDDTYDKYETAEEKMYAWWDGE